MIDDLSLYRGTKIEYYIRNWTTTENEINKAIELVLNVAGESTISYLYFGNEFCEYRIPSTNELIECIELCNQVNIKPVLVTPPVTELGICRINNLLSYVENNNICLDVVINDFGVLELLNEKKIQGEKIVGRILDKTSHDSRASCERIDNYYGKEGLTYAKTPGVISMPFRKVLENYSVDRWEFDLPKVGLLLPNDINKSLYWPYGYLTTGRVCSMRAINLDGRKKFLVGENSCSQICRYVQIEKIKVASVCGSNETKFKLYQRGNTVFYLEQNENSIESFERIIFQV